MKVPLLILAGLMVPQESWLVGGWAPGQSQCGSDRGISFEADGTYNELDGEGIWTLAGDRLTVSSTGGDDFGRSDVVRLAVRSRAGMELEWPDGSRTTFHRCPDED